MSQVRHMAIAVIVIELDRSKSGQTSRACLEMKYTRRFSCVISISTRHTISRIDVTEGLHSMFRESISVGSKELGNTS
jgi:hypothetical protein